MPVIQIIMAISGKLLRAKNMSLLFFSSTAVVSLAHRGAQYVFIELNWKEGLPIDWNSYLGALIFPYKLIRETDTCCFKQIHFRVFLNNAI